jgi:PAS domain S-box-containing protein
MILRISVAERGVQDPSDSGFERQVNSAVDRTGPFQANDAVLAKLVRDSPVAIVASALPDGQILDVNDSFLRLTGYDREEVIGQTLTSLGIRVDLTQRTELSGALIDGQSWRNVEGAVQTKSGEECQVLATVSEVDIDDCLCLLTQLVDVTDYRGAEIQFRALVEQLPGIIYTHGLQEPRELIYISPQVERMFGRSPAELVANQPDFLIRRIHPEDQQGLLAKAEEALRTLRPYRAEYRAQAADGRWIWLEDRASIVRDAHGQPKLWQGILVDITARKAAEEALSRSEARSRGLFEQSPDAILVTDAECHVIEVNQAALALLGYSREELSHLSVVDAVALEPGWVRRAFAKLHREGSWEGELELRAKNGNLLPVEARAIALHGPDGPRYVAFLRDLSERHRREVVQARLAALVESSADAIVSVSLEGLITDWNAAAEQLFGYTAEEAIGQPITMLALAEQVAESEAFLAQTARGESITGVETVRRRKDGRLLDVALTAAPIKDGAGRVVGSSRILRDITERKQTEAALRESEKRLAQAQEIAHLGSWEWDIHSDTVFWSDELFRIFGLEPGGGAGTYQDFLALVQADDREMVASIIAETMVSGVPFASQHRIVRADGSVRVLQARGEVALDEAGRPVRLRGTAQDVTDLKQAEDALRVSEERFRTAFENAAIGIGLFDLDGRFLQVNQAYCTLTGYTDPELLSTSFKEITHPDDLEADLTQLRRLLAGEMSSYQIEKRYIRKDGEAVWVRLTVALVHDHRGAPHNLIGQAEDITARKRAEDELRTSEVRYRALVEQIPAVVYVLAADENQTPLYFSPRIHELTGESPDEALALKGHWRELVHPDDYARVAEEDERTSASGEPFRLEYRHRRRDGSYVWIQDECVPLHDSNGQVVAWQGVMLDMTARRQAEEALRASEARFRALVQNSSDIIVVLDADGKRKYVSPASERLLGYAPSDLVGGNFEEIVHPDDAPTLWQAIRACVDGARQTEIQELRLRHRDGSWRDYEVIGTNLLDEPTVAGIVFNSREITGWKATQAALRESEDRFRSAFDHAPIGVSLEAPDGQFIQVNRAFCALVGYSEQELLDKRFQDITHPDDLADELEVAGRLWAGEIDSYELEKRYIHKDGRIVWVLLTRSAVRQGNASRYSVTQVLDITGRRHLDMERATMLVSEREYSRQLRDLTEMRADLTAMIAHELRGPVSALRLMTFLLAQGELSSPDQTEMFNAINGEIAQLDRLIRDMTAVTEAEREDFSVDPHWVPLSVLLESAVAFGRTSLSDRPFSVSDTLNVRVWCDPERMSQVLHNLLDNAARHTPPGTPVELRTHQVGNRVRIEVADRGPGLPAEDVGLIFEKFGRGQQAAARQTPGAGLGLYLSRQIVQAHGSDLTVESMPGQGSVFAFELEAMS